jgi:cobalt/nickel transport system permease protein
VFLGAGLLVALLLAFFVSPLASNSPDGLNKVAADHGLDSNAKASSANPASKSPTANYSTKGISDTRLSKGVSGVIGVLLTLLIGWALFTWMKRMRVRAGAAAGGTGAGPAEANAPPGSVL